MLLNDVAVIELENPATFNQFVSPVCLPNTAIPDDGQLCYATGYGIFSEFYYTKLKKLTC